LFIMLILLLIVWPFFGEAPLESLLALARPPPTEVRALNASCLLLP
jgi:hypothetical protein